MLIVIQTDQTLFDKTFDLIMVLYEKQRDDPYYNTHTTSWGRDEWEVVVPQTSNGLKLSQ